MLKEEAWLLILLKLMDDYSGKTVLLLECQTDGKKFFNGYVSA